MAADKKDKEKFHREINEKENYLMEVAMDIYVGKISGGFSGKKRYPNAEINKERRNRRKTKADRRKSVRGGVIVSIDSRNDKRSGKDRRRVANLD